MRLLELRLLLVSEISACLAASAPAESTSETLGNSSDCGNPRPDFKRSGLDFQSAPMHSPETGTPQLRIAAILLCRSRAIVYSVRLFGLRCKLVFC